MQHIFTILIIILSALACITYLYSKNWPMAIYMGSCAVINGSVLWMGVK